MKQLVAIAFSLLLIAAQTFAVKAPVSSGSSMAKPGCCDENCYCCVSQSDAPSVPPVEATAPVAAQNQFIFPPVATVAFTLAAPPHELSSAPAAAESHAATPPIFRWNCALLI